MFSNSARYALRAMAHLAADDRAHTADELAAEAEVPRMYVAKVMTPLVRAGLVSAQRGLRGGYRLGRPAAAISVLEVIRAIDAGSAFDPSLPSGQGGCEANQADGLLDDVRMAAERRLARTGLDWLIRTQPVAG